MRNAANPAEIDRQRERAKEDKRTRDTVLTSLMGEQRGRRFIWLELEKSHIFQATFDDRPGNFARMCHREGERNIGLRTLTDLTRLCPQQFVKMLLENSKQEEEINGGPSSTPEPDSGTYAFHDGQ